MEYRITVGDREEKVTIIESDGRYRVEIDGTAYEVDARRIEPGMVLSMLVDGQSHEAEVVPSDGGYHIHLPSRSFEVGLEHEVLARAGAKRGGAKVQGPVALATQMPGVVVDIKVEPGAPVTAGEPLIIVEAMKMQNEFVAPASGVIQEIKVKVGDAVAAGQVLATIDAGEND
jgi:acetyl-CoA/propionyl-CoA carboxylase biotin carboxyl carrier protein